MSRRVLVVSLAEPRPVWGEQSAVRLLLDRGMAAEVEMSRRMTFQYFRKDAIAARLGYKRDRRAVEREAEEEAEPEGEEGA